MRTALRSATLLFAAITVATTLPTCTQALAIVGGKSSMALPAAGNTNGPCDLIGPVDCPSPVATSDGYVYAYDAATQTFVPVPKSAAGTAAPDTFYRYAISPACPNALPFNAIDCVTADQFCATVGQAGVHENVWREEIAPVATTWIVVGALCTGGAAAPISIQAAAAGASEFEQDHLPVPTPVVQPGAIAIVNLPIIVSVAQAGPQILQVQLPVPGELIATPSYSWTFNNGITITGPGIPYDGTDPRADPTHYVSDTYTAADPAGSVTLTVTWTATFTVAGIAVPVPPVVMPPIVTTFTVHEARSVLVTG
jgi:hypothetical protein